MKYIKDKRVFQFETSGRLLPLYYGIIGLTADVEGNLGRDHNPYALRRVLKQTERQELADFVCDFWQRWVKLENGEEE
jgi:hypothetical protein